MNKKFLIALAIIIVILLIIATTMREDDKVPINESQSVKGTTNDIYDLMMNTVSRNIIGMDPSRMSSDEQEFYYEYLYDDSEEIEMYYEE